MKKKLIIVFSILFIIVIVSFVILSTASEESIKNNFVFKLGFKLFFRSLIAIKPSDRHTIEFKDGYQATYYTFTLGDENNIDTYIFIATGSGYASGQWFRIYFEDLPGNVKAFSLQKRYVKHNASPVDKPPEEYHKYNFLSQTIADQVEFIKTILSENDIHGKKIVMYGVSEGGDVAPAIVSQIPEITHLVVLGNGGMKGIDAFRIWGESQGIPIDEVYKIVSKNTSTDKFFGYTYKYWKEMLDMNHMDYLINLNIPIFYCNGANDQSSPIESLYYLRDEFAKLKKDNLKIKIYPDCDHSLEDSKGDEHRADFMREISKWLNN